MRYIYIPSKRKAKEDGVVFPEKVSAAANFSELELNFAAESSNLRLRLSTST